MRNTWRQLFRENLLGVSLVMIGMLVFALAGLTYVGHGKAPGVVLANGNAVDGPDTNVLEQENAPTSASPGSLHPRSSISAPLK